MNKYFFGVIAVVVACGKSSGDQVQTSARDTTAQAAAVHVGDDSLRGTLQLAGTDTLAGVALVTATGTVTLAGDQIESLRRIIGLDVTVRGKASSPSTFVAQEFFVRSALGEPAVDGILDVENGVFFLRTSSGGRATISAIPPMLRGEIGSRVYLVGSLDRLPTSFGVIAERQ